MKIKMIAKHYPFGNVESDYRQINKETRYKETRYKETRYKETRYKETRYKETRCFFTIYYINVQSPNLDLKLGIKPKAGNFLSRKREREGGWGIG